MNCKWKKCKLGDLGTVITGKTPATKIAEYWDGIIPFITPKDLQETKHVFCTERTISYEGMEAVRGCILPVNSVCVSCIGNIGYTGITTCKSITNQQINSIIVNEFNNSDFVYYLLRNLWTFFKNYEGQSTTLSILNKTQFSKIEVTVPDLGTQKKIAKILSALDDKIECNNQINKNLEEQVKVLYKHFFPYNVEDDLPEEWCVGIIGDVVEFHDSKRVPLSGSERLKMEKKIYPYYGAADLMDYVDNFIFDGKYLLLGEDGTVINDEGYPILQYVWGKFWVNNHAHILTGKRGFNVESLYMLFKQTPVKSIVTGAVQPKISQSNLRSVNIVIPPENVLIDYNNRVESLFAAIRLNEEENKSLSLLRDSLLPKLMSGELDVDKIEI